MDPQAIHENRDSEVLEEQNASPDSLRPSQNSHHVDVTPVMTKSQGEMDGSMFEGIGDEV